MNMESHENYQNTKEYTYSFLLHELNDQIVRARIERNKERSEITKFNLEKSNRCY